MSNLPALDKQHQKELTRPARTHLGSQIRKPESTVFSAAPPNFSPAAEEHRVCSKKITHSQGIAQRKRRHFLGVPHAIHLLANVHSMSRRGFLSIVLPEDLRFSQKLRRVILPRIISRNLGEMLTIPINYCSGRIFDRNGELRLVEGSFRCRG